MELANQAATKNRPFILSLSAPFIPQFFKEPLDASAPYWDYVIGNETEAASYSESHGLGLTDVKEIAKAMANLPKANTQRKRVAIVTQGTEPTIVAVQGEDEVKEYPVHKIAKEEINDTTGAGDAFAGGFVAGIIEGKPLDVCIDMGQWLARLSIKELGPSYVFSRCYVASLIDTHCRPASLSLMLFTFLFSIAAHYILQPLLCALVMAIVLALQRRHSLQEISSVLSLPVHRLVHTKECADSISGTPSPSRPTRPRPKEETEVEVKGSESNSPNHLSSSLGVADLGNVLGRVIRFQQQAMAAFMRKHMMR